MLRSGCRELTHLTELKLYPYLTTKNTQWGIDCSTNGPGKTGYPDANYK